ncbi:MAG: prolyl aminopeptidase [Gammaproteobacteria bacterium]
MNASATLYPPISPHDSGVLPVSGGHRLAYEVCGNPKGFPAIFLHGGPGAGCAPFHRQFFDPAVYRIVLLDQRGAGRSTPYASIENNTTWDLVRDIEQLRETLGIERWLVFGGSWGSTLALAYASRHPDRCAALVLRGIWLCRPSDVKWWFEDIRMVYPDYWKDFTGYIPSNERDELLAAYSRRLNNPDPAIHDPAAAAWDRYETRCSRLIPSGGGSGSARLALARLEAHYMTHGAFLRPNELIEAVPRFRNVPGIIIHGRYDMLCPLEGAVMLASAWPEAVLEVVPDAGHSALEPGISQRLVAATNRFRELAPG